MQKEQKPGAMVQLKITKGDYLLQVNVKNISFYLGNLTLNKSLYLDMKCLSYRKYSENKSYL